MFGRSRLRRERGAQLPRNLFGLLAERERSHAARGLDLELLRWAADEWVRQPQMRSDYCQLHAEAKSTIALAFSADGELFASTHGDHTVKVFSCSSWRLLCTLRGHERTPWTVKFHPKQRRYLASGSLDQSVRIWDLHTRQCIRRQYFDFVVSCIAFHSTGELVAVTAGKRTFLWQWQAQGGEEAVGDESPGRQDGVKVVLMDGTNPQRCVAFKRSATHELFFVAETNAETPPEPPSRPAGAQQAPPFTVQLFMWLLLPQDAEEHMRLRLEPGAADLRVARSVMYSDAGFDVSCCGRYLALCELDPQARGEGLSGACFVAGAVSRAVGYHLRTFSLQRGSMGAQLQTVVLPNCPFVTSVQFAPLNFAVLIGYGRCQAPEPGQRSRYAVLRCILFDTSTTERLQTEEVELFSVDSHDESNVALFHPQPTAAAQLGFVYATKDGRIRAFRFDR